jgi:hypothetical protein
MAAALICLASLANADLLNGYYQITSLTITENDRPRGFNNTGLYIYANNKRVKIAGAWRGYPFERNMTVDRTVSDTLFLRDPQDHASLYRFHVKNNTITGRHAIKYDDGTRRIIETKAAVRKLNQSEIDRIKAILDF